MEEEEALGWKDFEHGLVVVWWRISQRLAREAVPQILEGVVLSVEMALEEVWVLELAQLSLLISWLEVVLVVLPSHVLKKHSVDFQIVYVRVLLEEAVEEEPCFFGSQFHLLVPEHSVLLAVGECSPQ